MASPPLFLLFLFSLISLSPIAANARPGPCNTLFISFTVSSSRPPFQFSYASDPQKSNEVFTILRDVDDSNPKLSFLPSSSNFLEHPDLPQFLPFDEASNGPRQLETAPLFPFAGLSASSVRDRTKDILSVVVALLFGVSCGALTAATMYLAWSVIMSAYDAGDSDGEDEADDVSRKTANGGYVKIPAAADSAVPAGKGYEEN
ncbi:hypothetical protein ACLOJK_017209 [Asimina triloba]